MIGKKMNLDPLRNEQQVEPDVETDTEPEPFQQT